MNHFVEATVISHLNVCGMVRMENDVDVVSLFELSWHTESFRQVEDQLFMSVKRLECSRSYPSQLVAHVEDFTPWTQNHAGMREMKFLTFSSISNTCSFVYSV